MREQGRENREGLLVCLVLFEETEAWRGGFGGSDFSSREI